MSDQTVRATLREWWSVEQAWLWMRFARRFPRLARSALGRAYVRRYRGCYYGEVGR